ncbi:MAG: metallophosphoesterase family protein [Pseudomonadota bacterium]
MKIGVISDTHLSEPSDEFREIISLHFKEADIILHAGDVVEKRVLEAFLDYDLRAVSGNMDSTEIKSILPPKQIIKTDKFKIGLIHGWGGHSGLEKKIITEFKDVDCIVFGHTHSPVNHIIDDVLFFNPGALANRWHKGNGSLGFLELSDTIKGTIIKV